MTTMTTTTTTDLPPVACPACASPADAECLTPSGKPTRPHAARDRMARGVANRRARTRDTTRDTIAVDTAGDAEVTHTPTPAPTAELTVADLDREALAVHLLVLAVLEKRVAEAKGDARAEGAGRLRIGDQVSGYLTEDHAKAGRSLGRVGLSRGSKSWKVTDVDKLTAWVVEHYPDEIETRPVVRNSFLAAVMAKHKVADCWITADGEAVEVPGIELSEGNPTLTVKTSDEAAALVAEALAAGLVQPNGMPTALPAGTTR